MVTKINLLVRVLVIVCLVIFMKVNLLQANSYEEIDRYILNTPKSAEQSVETLASYLIKPAKNDLEKVRAIYRWVTENIDYNVEGYFSGNYGNLNPTEVLKQRVAVCDGYAGLFESLASAAGLEVVKIRGYGKGYSYLVGSHFENTNHSWNAVKIDEQWHLLDCTWGAGYVNEKKQFVRQFEEHYFLTPPDQFIYDHLSEDPKWQLLEKPISKEEYEQLVYLRPAFFNHSLKLVSHFQNVIQTDDRLLITLSAPDEILLLATLEKDEQKLEGSFTFVQKYAGQYNIYAIFSDAGSYVLRIFTKRKGEPGLYDWALDYKVEASAGNKEPVAFPEAYSSFNEHGVYLHSPMNGYIKSQTTQIFKLNVPGAEDVAVIIGGEWFHLKKQGDLFEGEVIISKGKVGVYAKFPGDTNYTGLLQYTGF